jgi:hypothetical protein
MENKDKIILEGECTGNNDNGCFMESPGHDCGCFKRIQQEEPKQETTGKEFYESADAVITVSKQETFEEVANNWIKNTSEFLSVKNGFMAGAKWQAERMYSEEDVYHILCEHTAFLFAGGKSTLSEWFEQYKKK